MTRDTRAIVRRRLLSCRFVRSSPALLALVCLCWAPLGCEDDGDPASPSVNQGELSEAGSFDAAAPDAGVSYAVCAPGVDAGFGDLLTKVFSTGSCGNTDPTSCHSTSGSAKSSNGLDFTLAPAAVYKELLGSAGTGQLATNASGDTPVLRVAPFDAGASMLYIKLTLTTVADPHYGAGMPLTAPGSICPATLDAVKTWIELGAKND